jgi:hypothetical protein
MLCAPPTVRSAAGQSADDGDPSRRSCRSRTTTWSSAHFFRVAYMLIVIEVQLPSAINKSS